MAKTVQEWLGEDNKIGIDIWEKKYRFNNESFNEWLNRVSGNNEKLKQLIVDKKFLFGGRALSNRGIDNKSSMFNCYSRGFIQDDLKDILQANTDIALTYKAQGGQGLSLSKLRPKGTPIGDRYVSDGIIPFMKMYNETTSTISQGGSRKGALMISLDARHKEVEDFIKIKSNNSEISKANLSLEVDDKFMEAVKKSYETGKNIVLHECKKYNGHVIEYDIIPIKIFKLMCKYCYDWADPACIFTNRFRNYNLMEFVDGYQIETCNPCFSGNMELLTIDGYKTFEELCETEPYIYNVNGNVVKSKVWCSGEKDTVKVKIGKGEIICTPEHRFMTIDGDECMAKDLKGKYIMPCTIANTKFNEKYVKLGFIQGDGQLSRLNSQYHDGLEVNIGKKDTDIFDLFSNESFTYKSERAIYLNGFNEELINLGFSPTNLPDRIFPTTYNQWTKNEKASFLHGCYSANGSVIKNGRIAYKTTCKKFAEQLSETLLNDFDIQGVYITTNKPKRVNFENGEYECRESYDVNIGKYKEITKFIAEINFYQQYKREQLSQMMKNRPTYVFNVEPYKTIKVYDFTESERHWGIVEGYVVHNCGEQPMPKNFSCNLGSLNMYEYVVNKFTSDAYFDYDEFSKDIAIAIEALDTIIDENANNHALEEQRNNSLNYRNIGLGVFGYANTLMALKLTYGSEDSKIFTDKVFNHMFKEAVFASSDLAVKLGSFSKYNEKIWDSEIIQNHFTQTEIEYLKKKGLRNCSLLSIAPTGSIATMLSRSGGCEPEFSISYQRKTESLNNGKEKYYEVFCKTAQDYIDINNDNNLPHYFISSQDINWINRIDIQSIMQNHVDTAISSTVNLPNETTLQEVEDLYLYAWEQGLKGITIYRDGCNREGILTTNKNNKTEFNNTLNRGDILCVSDDLLSCKRTIINGCGKFYLHCDFDEFTGEPLETFIDIGSGGGCERNLQFISRLISLLLRAGVPVEEIIDQAMSIRPCKAYTDRTKSKEDTSKGTSCPSAIGYALKELQEKIHNRCFVDESESTAIEEINENNSPINYKNVCPECGAKMQFEGGCSVCKECGFSHCG